MPARHQRTVRPSTALRLRALIVTATLAGAVAYPGRADASDGVQCAIEDGRIACDVELGGFYRDQIRDVLNNGWENTVQFRLVIRDESIDDVVAISFSNVAQRCYIDPFDDPCLTLWSGAETWETFDDVDAMIDEIASFTLVSVPIEELGAGTYTAHLETQLNPITDEQVSVIRGWLARHRGGHLVVGKNESSIFGTFVSVFANVRSGKAEATVHHDAPTFVIE